MANILALDTSTDACSVALNIDGEVSEIFKIVPRKHTHELLPMVEKILADAQLSVKELDAIAFGRGPGSFAGIRIATGASQGLAYAAKIPVLPVSTLAALAYQYYLDNPQYQGDILTALDARMDEVYWGVYRRQERGVEVFLAEAVAKPAELMGDFSLSQIGLGSGFCYRQNIPQSVMQQLVSIVQDVHPRAGAIAHLASIDFDRGLAISAEKAEPVYLRNQVTWKKKDQQ